ncbi:MAG: hypothetical protein ACRYG8_44165 [Janthinobacterium lividum]
MEHTFETVEQAEFDVPPEFEGWLYAAGFSPLLPDRLNVALLNMQAREEMPGHFVALITEGPAEFVGEVVTAVHVLISPDDHGLIQWMTEKLEIIERDGILDEETYWPLVDPILQKLWEEASPAGRVTLCAEAGAPADHVFEDVLPREVHPILYRQIAM